MKLLRPALLLAVILSATQAHAQAPQTPAANSAARPAPKTIGVPAARKYSDALIVLNAKGAKLSGQTLTLDGPAPAAILFASRPARSAGHLPTTELVDLWTTGSFAKDPPNATVSAFAKDGSAVTDAVVTMRNPRRDGDKLVFDVAVLEGSLGNADGPVSVFIDTIWFGVGDGGVHYLGQNQTTGGTDPAIGSRYDTSTLSGWSNPAPSGPVYRQPSNTFQNAPPDWNERPGRNCGAPPLLPCY